MWRTKNKKTKLSCGWYYNEPVPPSQTSLLPLIPGLRLRDVESLPVKLNTSSERRAADLQPGINSTIVLLEPHELLKVHKKKNPHYGVSSPSTGPP